MTPRGKGEKCTHCKRTMMARTDRSSLRATRDHYPIPKWMGGRVTVWACSRCNHLKGGLTENEWHTFMANNPEWWRKEDHDRRKTRDYSIPLPVSRPPYHVTQAFLRESALRQMVRPIAVPKEYDDPKAQAAFEAVYANRLHLLRVEKNHPLAYQGDAG